MYLFLQRWEAFYLPDSMQWNVYFVGGFAQEGKFNV